MRKRATNQSGRSVVVVPERASSARPEETPAYQGSSGISPRFACRPLLRFVRSGYADVGKPPWTEWSGELRELMPPRPASWFDRAVGMQLDHGRVLSD